MIYSLANSMAIISLKLIKYQKYFNYFIMYRYFLTLFYLNYSNHVKLFYEQKKEKEKSH